jgi:hypothetical protein
MKKLIYLLTCFMLFATYSYSQKAKLGFTTGVAIGSYKLKADPVSITSKSKAGITLGIIADVPIGASGSFMPALNFVQKGGTLKADGMKDKLIINYLELPLNFVYKASITGGKLFLGAGPSLNAGISGKDKWEVEGSSGSDKVKFGKDKDFKRFDASVNFIAGYLARSGMMVTLNYNSGLSNSVDSGDSEGEFYNRYFGLRIGYMF